MSRLNYKTQAMFDKLKEKTENNLLKINNLKLEYSDTGTLHKIEGSRTGKFLAAVFILVENRYLIPEKFGEKIVSKNMTFYLNENSGLTEMEINTRREKFIKYYRDYILKETYFGEKLQTDFDAFLLKEMEKIFLVLINNHDKEIRIEAIDNCKQEMIIKYLDKNNFLSFFKNFLNKKYKPISLDTFYYNEFNQSNKSISEFITHTGEKIINDFNIHLLTNRCFKRIEDLDRFFNVIDLYFCTNSKHKLQANELKKFEQGIRNQFKKLYTNTNKETISNDCLSYFLKYDNIFND